MAELTPRDRDMVIRTVIGEAGDQPALGQAAVVHAILNRLNAGEFGKNPTQIVLAPGQFEPWQTKPQELATIPRNSPAYQSVGALVDNVWGGKIPDPTNGATHFLQPDIVMKRRGKLPEWASGEPVRIAQHNFYNPKKSEKVDVDALLDSVARPNAGTEKVDIDALFDKLPKRDATSSAPNQPVSAAPATPPQPPIYGVNDEGKEVLLPPMAAPSPEQINRPQPGIGEKLSDIGGQFVKDFSESYKAGTEGSVGMMSKGVEDISKGLSATGIGELGMGGLGYLTSVTGLNAALDAGISKPIERLTGNKEFAEKAAMLLPSASTLRVAQAARPKVSALRDIIRDAGSDNLPQIIKRLENNPKLTLADISPVVQAQTAGMATNPANPKVMNELSNFSKKRMSERGGDLETVFQDVLGPKPNMAETKKALKEAAEKTGKEAIEPALARTQFVDVTNVVRNIDKEFPAPMLKSLKDGKEPALPMTEEQKRLWALREKIRGGLPDRDAMFLDPETAHSIQKELRRKYSGDPLLGYEARQVRRELIDSIEAARKKDAPSYKAALKQYADDKATEEAFEEGFSIFSNSTSAEKSISNHPDMWKEWLKDASKSEIEALKKGIYFGAEQRIKNMRTGSLVPEGSFTHERIAAVVGDKEAQRIVDRLNDWRDIAAFDAMATKNSKTGVIQAAQKSREVRPARGGKQLLESMVPAALVGGIAHMSTQSPLLSAAGIGAGYTGGKLANIAGRAMDKSANKAYAQWATATGQKREDLLEMLREAARRSNSPSKGEKVLNALPAPFLQALPR